MDLRLKFDVPYAFAIEPGFVKSLAYSDFRPEKDSLAGCYREPVTGLVMLEPNAEARSWETDDPDAYRLAEDFWRRNKRYESNILLFGQVKPETAGFPLIEILVDVAIATKEAEILLGDTLLWVAEGKTALAADEGWQFSYHETHDEVIRKRNWLFFQWDNIGIHVDYTGIVRVYRYERNNLRKAPVIFEEFVLGAPEMITNRPGYFRFIPVPGLGLIMQHGVTGTIRMGAYDANVAASTVRGHLIRWPSTVNGSGQSTMFSSSPLRIGANPFHTRVFGLSRLRYPSSGTYVDATFDIKYVPSGFPSEMSAIVYRTPHPTSVGVALKRGDGLTAGVEDWNLHRQARVRATLSTSDSRYTPFYAGYHLKWDAVAGARDTTPYEPTKLQRLEYGFDEDGRGEGTAEFLMVGAQRMAIADRGDATFSLEYRKKATDPWTFVDGGLAKEWDVEFQPSILAADNTWHYKCSCSLRGMWERLHETMCLRETAFDGMRIGDALNTILTFSGFSPVAEKDLPAKAKTMKFPPLLNGKRFRFAPRKGEGSWQLVRLILRAMKSQNEEYRLRYDWQGVKWVIEKKPRDTATVWKLMPRLGTVEADGVAKKTWYYGPGAKMRPEPPDGNLIILEGMTTPDTEGKRLISMMRNAKSISDNANRDYLGRIITIDFEAEALQTQAEADLWARRAYDALAHGRKTITLTCPLGIWDLPVLARVKVYDDKGTVRFDAWVKRKTMVFEEYHQGVGCEPSMTLALDTVWDGEWGA